jgi:sec-independent protein translocase protein TatC
VLFGYYFMVPYAMFYLNSAVSLELFVPNIKLESFLAFATSLCLAFGAIFQLPLLMTFVGRFDLITPETFSRYRGHFIVGALVLAAILTPPDPITQLMLGIPMVVLYEIGIVGARFSRRSRRKLAS